VANSLNVAVLRRKRARPSQVFMSMGAASRAASLPRQGAVTSAPLRATLRTAVARQWRVTC
jgi:hypothetical protein